MIGHRHRDRRLAAGHAFKGRLPVKVTELLRPVGCLVFGAARAREDEAVGPDELLLGLEIAPPIELLLLTIGFRLVLVFV
jgi:hypothetical protein